MAYWDLDLGAGTVGNLFPVADVLSGIVEIVDPAMHMDRGEGSAVRGEELEIHIHSELFGKRFPTTPSIGEWKDQRKQAVMLRSVKIMRRHEQSDIEIVQMLEDKFFLTKEEAYEFMKNTVSTKEEICFCWQNDIFQTI